MPTTLRVQAAYGFHAMREAHGWATSSRFLNQAWYGWYSCSSGWFCGAQVRAHQRCARLLLLQHALAPSTAADARWHGSLSHPTPLTPPYPATRPQQPLVNKMRLRVRDGPGAEWREVAVPKSVRALVLLNLQARAWRVNGWLACEGLWCS